MPNPYPRIVSGRKGLHGIYPVPIQYKLPMPFKYPSDNTFEFERWYMNTYTASEATQRIYLPVLWTSYHCSKGFGKQPGPLKTLQGFIDKLPREHKYYTICQFDDGPMVDFKDLDIIVFGMAGGRNDYPIPLLCQPHAHVKTPHRDITASFIGRMTHEARKAVMELAGKNGFYITDIDHGIINYTTIMQRSVFVLCPRGYSATSFRIMEAIHAGAIPVYISDEYILPYALPFDYGILLRPDSGVVRELSDVSEEKILELRANMGKVKHLFTYQGCKARILEVLRNES